MTVVQEPRGAVNQFWSLRIVMVMAPKPLSTPSPVIFMTYEAGANDKGRIEMDFSRLVNRPTMIK